MAFLYLRFLIGGAAVLSVALVAAVTLGLSVTIAFRSIRGSAEMSIRSLGTATAITANAFFDALSTRLKTLASSPLWTPDATSAPSDDPAFDAADGGPTLQSWRRALIAFAVKSEFTEFSNNVVFVDGSGCRTFPLVLGRLRLYAVQCSTKTATYLSMHEMPSGRFNAAMTAAFAPRFAFAIPPSLLTPSYTTKWESWLNATGPEDIQWTPPVGVHAGTEDFFVVTLRTRIHNESGSIGFGDSHLRVEDFTGILTAAKLTANSEVFVYDQDQFLIGASSGLRTFVGVNFTGVDTTPGCSSTAQSTEIYPSNVPRRMCRDHLTASVFEPLSTTAAADPAFFATAGTAGQVRLIRGNYVFAQRLPTLTGAQRFFLAAVTPEADVLGDAETILPITAGVTAGVVVIVAVASFVLVWLVLRPLQGIAERMGKAARLEADDGAVAISPIEEIGALQRAFVEMRDELGRIRAFVPQSLRANIEVDDEEDDNEECLSETPSEAQRKTAYETSDLVVRGTRSSFSVGSVRSAQSAIDPRGKKTLTHMTGTRRETVAVLCVNLLGFHAATEKGLDSGKMAAVVDAVLAAAQSQKGVVDSFHGDRFMVTFNAAKPCASCGIRAALTATRIAAKLGGGTQGQGHQSESENPRESSYSLPVSCGLAVGTAQVGNVGSAAMKSFAVVGPVVSQAAVLERMCKVHGGAQCLVPQRLFADLATAVRLRTVDLVTLPAKKACLVADVVGEHVQGGGDDEWMYQLHAQEHGGRVGADGAAAVDPVQVCNSTWALIAEGRGADAVTCFKQLPVGYDGAAEHPCHRRVSEIGTDAVMAVASTPTPFEHLTSRIDALRRSGGDRDEPPLSHDLGVFYKASTGAW